MPFLARTTLALSLCFTLSALAQTPDYHLDKKFISTITDARKLVHERQYAFAIDAYKKANKIAGGKDPDSLKNIYDLQMKLGYFKDAANTASTMLEAAATPTEKSFAESKRGNALYLQAGDKGKPDLLKAADESYKAAIADNPQQRQRPLHGRHRSRPARPDRRRPRQFKTCLTASPPTIPATSAPSTSPKTPPSPSPNGPALHRHPLDGTRFNLDEMGGRVVLIDFWATWCGPCNEELPHIKKIAKEFAGQPLVIISVSWDSDETKWKNFIDQHEMTWVQYRDADHSISNAFGVKSIPHYFTIDSDGILTAEMMGSGSDVEGKLKKLLARAHPTPAPATNNAQAQ